jgi:hypothetical protein
MELKKCLAVVRTYTRHRTAQLHDAATIAAVANHLVEARGAQSGILLQGLTEECDVGIDEGRPQWLHAAEAFRLDGVSDGIGMDAQFTCNRADFPMLRVKVAANLRAGFLADHRDHSPSVWNTWKWIDESSEASADAAAQPRA